MYQLFSPLVSIFVLYEILPTLRSERYVYFQKLYAFGFYHIPMILQEIENQTTLIARKQSGSIFKKKKKRKRKSQDQGLHW